MTIESIRQRHNEQLLRVLEQEQEQEERRERILRGIKVSSDLICSSELEYLVSDIVAIGVFLFLFFFFFIKFLRTFQDEEERRRLDRVFGLERAKSSQRIMRITEEHEMVLANKMAEAGIIRCDRETCSDGILYIIWYMYCTTCTL